MQYMIRYFDKDGKELSPSEDRYPDYECAETARQDNLAGCPTGTRAVVVRAPYPTGLRDLIEKAVAVQKAMDELELDEKHGRFGYDFVDSARDDAEEPIREAELTFESAFNEAVLNVLRENANIVRYLAQQED